LSSTTSIHLEALLDGVGRVYRAVCCTSVGDTLTALVAARVVDCFTEGRQFVARRRRKALAVLWGLLPLSRVSSSIVTIVLG
jgi:hypothetical protein